MNEGSVTTRAERTEGAAPPPSGGQKERIRLAAVQLFSRQGFAGTSMKQLARALNTVPANLYNYFPNKEAILLDVLEHQLLNRRRRDREIIETGGGARVVLGRLVADLVANDLHDPVAAFVGIQGLRGLTEENSAYISGLMGDIRSAWTDVLGEGAASGAFHLRDAKLTALSILTLCSSVSSWYRPEGEYSADYVAEGVAELALRMAGCPA